MKTLLLSALLFLALRPAFAIQETASVYEPGKTTVAVLPATTLSTDKWKELKEKEALKAREVVTDLFTRYGFQLVAAAKSDEALAKSGVDLKNEESWIKSNFYKIGKEAGTDLVAFVLIKQTRQIMTGSLLARQDQAHAEIEVWLVDARQEKPLLNGEPAKGKATGGNRMATTRRLSAVEIAVKKAMEPFFKAYPRPDKTQGGGKKGSGANKNAGDDSSQETADKADKTDKP